MPTQQSTTMPLQKDTYKFTAQCLRVLQLEQVPGEVSWCSVQRKVEILWNTQNTETVTVREEGVDVA